MRVVEKGPRWSEPESLPWVNDQDIAADYLMDFRTLENVLSLWIVEDDESNLEAIVAAYAANRDNPQKLDFVLFANDVITDSAITVQFTPGTTYDSQINARHLTLIELSGFKVVALIRAILDSDYNSDKRDKVEVMDLVAQAVDAQRLPYDKLHPNWKRALDNRLSQPRMF